MKSLITLVASLWLLLPVGNAFAEVMVEDVVVREMLPGSKSTAGYFTLINHTDQTIALESAELTLSDRVEIHEHISANGMMKMQKVEKPLVVKPHYRLTFAPGGYHLMIFAGKKPIKKGMSYQLTLRLSNQQALTLSGKVVSVLDMHQQSEHAHH